MQSRFLQVHAVTRYRTLVLKQHRPKVRQEGGLSASSRPVVRLGKTRSSLGESPAAPPCFARGAGRGTAVTPWRIHGPSTLREGRPRQNDRCEEARLEEAYRVHDAPEDTQKRQQGYTGYARRM